MNGRGFCTVIAGMMSLAWVCAERPAPQAGKAGRSVAVGNNGMVATSHPLAAQVGLDILKQGGNAIDAAIATSAAMGLMEPMSCGIGGDLFAIVWDAKNQKLLGLNANGAAPKRATRDLFKSKGLKEIPETGTAQLVRAGLRGWLGGTPEEARYQDAGSTS